MKQIIFILSIFFGTLNAQAQAQAQAPNQSHPPIRVELADSDYNFRGVKKDLIESWEDGRRTPQDSKHFEWWYFDAVLKDGTALTIVFSDNFALGTGTRALRFDVTPPGKPTRSFKKIFTELGAFATDKTDIQMAGHSVTGDLNTYHVRINPELTEGYGCDLQLKRLTPSYRTGTGFKSSGEFYFAWLNAVPYGELTGSLTIDNQKVDVQGHGYHDHNWGNIPPQNLFENWWWGRSQMSDKTVVATAVKVRPEWGGHLFKTVFMATENKITKYLEDEVIFEEGPLVMHPDPLHTREIPAFVQFSSKSNLLFSLKMPVQNQRLLVSHDLLNDVSPERRKAAEKLGLKPWYSRFEFAPTLELVGQPPQIGHGVFEYYEFK